MRNKTIIGTLIGIIALVSALLVFQPPVSAGPSSKDAVESAGCQNGQKDAKMIWENLSQQFFSTM